MRTTGPILAGGAIVMANAIVFNGKPFDIRVPLAAGITAGGFALFEKLNSDMAVAMAYLVLVSILFVRATPDTPTPIETIQRWWQGGEK